MPLFQIGYRRYEGQRTSHATRWWPITRTGLAIAWRSKLLRRLEFVAFLPFLYFGWVFFVIGRITDPGTDPSAPFYELARDFLGNQLANQLHDDPAAIRSAVWTIVFGYFGTYFQLWIAALVAAVVGPSLVANDLRTRAFLIYFARPVSRLDYVIGKTGVLVAVLASVTLLPSLTLYALSILFSPSFDTIAQTLPVAGTIVLATLGTIVPAALLLLVLSSLTRRPRFAAIAWFVICLFGPLAHLILQETRGLRDNGWTFLISLPHTVRTFQLGLYDVEGRAERLAVEPDIMEMIQGLTTSDSPLWAGIWLGMISLTCVLILLWRVDSPTRI
jgi:ABC-2 type transport system permease protein